MGKSTTKVVVMALFKFYPEDSASCVHFLFEPNLQMLLFAIIVLRMSLEHSFILSYTPWRVYVQGLAFVQQYYFVGEKHTNLVIEKFFSCENIDHLNWFY